MSTGITTAFIKDCGGLIRRSNLYLHEISAIILAFRTRCLSRIHILPSILAPKHIINLLASQFDTGRITFIGNGKSVNAGFADEGGG